jgi:hypothetical protein
MSLDIFVSEVTIAWKISFLDLSVLIFPHSNKNSNQLKIFRIRWYLALNPFFNEESIPRISHSPPERSNVSLSGVWEAPPMIKFVGIQRKIVKFFAGLCTHG